MGQLSHDDVKKGASMRRPPDFRSINVRIPPRPSLIVSDYASSAFTGLPRSSWCAAAESTALFRVYRSAPASSSHAACPAC